MSEQAIRNEALEAAARRIEQLSGNDVYERAWKAAARHVRKMKVLTDKQEQISSSSPRPV